MSMYNLTYAFSFYRICKRRRGKEVRIVQKRQYGYYVQETAEIL